MSPLQGVDLKKSVGKTTTTTTTKNSAGLFRCAMTFFSSTLAQKCPYVCSRTGIALCFTQFVRWRGHFKNKHFLVCHSHTPTHSAAPASTPSDNVAPIVPLLNKVNPHVFKTVLGQFIFFDVATFIYLVFFNSS